MKKMIKLSLVAAVAVAGLTTTASAGSLEEMIKGTTLSGAVQYTMEKVGDSTKEAQHDIDIRATLKSKVNDNITSVIRFDEANDDDLQSYRGAATTQNSSPVTMEIDRAYFSYKNDGLTSNFGLITVPYTDGTRGDGITVSKKVGALSVGAGYYYNTGTTKTQDVSYASVAGKAGVAGFSAVYATVSKSDVDATLNAGNIMFANVNMMAGPAKVAVDYSTKSIDTKDTQTQMKVSANVKAGAVTIDAAYAQNGSNGGATMLPGANNSGPTDLHIDYTGALSSLTDASGMYVAATAKVGAANTLKVAYLATSTNTVGEKDETVTAVTFTNKMSKNFKVFANYETYDVNTRESELTLGAKYSF